MLPASAGLLQASPGSVRPELGGTRIVQHPGRPLPPHCSGPCVPSSHLLRMPTGSETLLRPGTTKEPAHRARTAAGGGAHHARTVRGSNPSLLGTCPRARPGTRHFYQGPQEGLRKGDLLFLWMVSIRGLSLGCSCRSTGVSIRS